MNDTVVDQFKKGNNNLMIEIFADHPGQSGGADAGGGGKGIHTSFNYFIFRIISELVVEHLKGSIKNNIIFFVLSYIFQFTVL